MDLSQDPQLLSQPGCLVFSANSRSERPEARHLAAEYDLALDRHETTIARAADALEDARAARDLAALIRALDLDLIGPDDFYGPRVRSRTVADDRRMSATVSERVRQL